MQSWRYPKNWQEISARIRAREGNRCQFCGVKNGWIGYRRKDGEFVKVYESIADVDTQADALALDGIKLIRIVLTVAHLGVPKSDGRPGNPHDKSDVRDENLAALCQRCHLNYDRKEHLKNVAKTRRRKKLLSGQLEFSFRRLKSGK